MRRLFVAVALLALVALSRAENEESETPTAETEVFSYVSPPAFEGDDIFFAEDFDDDDEALRRWKTSSNPEFNGVWEFSEGPGDYSFKGDKGLITSEKARRYAIAAPTNKLVKFGDDTVIIQYQVRFANGLDCGGAYIKLLTRVNDAQTDVEKFDNTSPYTIMFGPDKCGVSSKLHFIFRHKSPVTGEIEEKHLQKMLTVKSDAVSHLYTLELRPNNEWAILIDKIQVATGSLLEDFKPSVNPPQEIDDPEDRKPVDWDDRKEIPDPEAKKPEDWDAPEEIPDPEAKKPEEWDEENDGEWEPPMIRNPEYKGEWSAPMIPNPTYSGEWSPRKIKNPHYFEDDHPDKMMPVDAVGFEIWTMNDGIVFDNIIITTNPREARRFADLAFQPRRNEEDRLEDLKHKSKLPEIDRGFFMDLVNKAIENPLLAVGAVLGGLVPIVVIFVFCSNSGSASDGAARAPKNVNKGKEKEPTTKEDGDDDDDDDYKEEKKVEKKETKQEESSPDTKDAGAKKRTTRSAKKDS